MSLTMNEAIAEGYGSRSTLMRRIKDGKLHPVRDGHKWLFDEDELAMMGKRPKEVEYQALVRRIVSQSHELTDEQIKTLVTILTSAR